MSIPSIASSTTSFSSTPPRPNSSHSNGRLYQVISESEPESTASAASTIWSTIKTIARVVAAFVVGILFLMATAASGRSNRTTTPDTTVDEAWNDIPADWLDTNPDFEAGQMPAGGVVEEFELPPMTDRLEQLTAEEITALTNKVAEKLAAPVLEHGDSVHVTNAKGDLATLQSALESAAEDDKGALRKAFLLKVSEFDCPIGLEPIQHPVVTTPCGHSFEAAGLRTAQDQDRRCPYCREDVSKVEQDTTAAALTTIFNKIGAPVEGEPLSDQMVIAKLGQALSAAPLEGGDSWKIQTAKIALAELNEKLAEADNEEEKAALRKLFIADLPSFKCHITTDLVEDPVVAYPCGDLFDGVAARLWKEVNDQCTNLKCKERVESLADDTTAARVVAILREAGIGQSV